jgi:seryl-tRNA synthetase
VNYTPMYSVTNGLATFGSEAIKIIQALDDQFLRLADEVNAERVVYPSLMKVTDLNKLDYFINFPHLGLAVSGLNQETCDCLTHQNTDLEKVSHEHITDSSYMLPSAACYNVYLHLKDQTLTNARYYTTVARCFRNENEYNELRRLWSFQMREIVCIGNMDEVQAFLSAYKEKVLALAQRLGIHFDIEVAKDPFYDNKSTKALMQMLQPVKEEFVFNRSVSAASVNFHRNFFGDRCNIRNENGEPLFSGCVAFGIERWLHAMLETYHHDIKNILKVLENE